MSRLGVCLSICLIFLVRLNFAQCGSENWVRNDDPVVPNIAGISPGSVWPKPQQQVNQNGDYYLVQVEGFVFVNVGQSTCKMVNDAFSRYYDLIFYPARASRAPRITNPLGHHLKELWSSDPKFQGVLTQLEVDLTGECQDWPFMDMDESYTLEVNETAQRLTANTNWGILRGLESFSQLIYTTDVGTFQVNATWINDFPRFSHRGVMLDTSRHFLSKKVILQNLDAMAYNKYNVFHWHLVDDQSFPYESTLYPLLSLKGAFTSHSHVYTTSDVAEVIEYARQRGIRVIAEFDTPGHTISWGMGYPDLLTKCYKQVNGSLVQNGYGPLNPAVNSTFDFVNSFLAEATRVFPDHYIHLGGDEVSFDCWKSNPDVVAFMTQMGYGDDYSRLEEYYMNTIIANLPPEASYIVWQEIIDNGVKVKNDTVVHVWKDLWPAEMKVVTGKGYRAILSSPWYLNHIAYGVDWYPFYQVEPLDFSGTPEEQKLVTGGETCMWGEYVDTTNVISRLWPRACAVSERLWSDASVTSTDEAAPRLETQRCRLLTRGLNAEPGNGPSFCDVDMSL